MNEEKSIGTGTIVDPKTARQPHKKGLIPPRTRILLQVEEGHGAGRVFDVSEGGELVIGRAGSDIPLEDEKVSRKHAELDLYGPYAYVLRDLASTNGTHVNGKRIADRVSLHSGDRIRMGETVLVFLVEFSEAEPPASNT